MTDLTKENDPNEHIPGKDCNCGAYGQYECGCEGVDWRSRREVQLEAENEELKKELAALRAEVEDWEKCRNFKSSIKYGVCGKCGLKSRLRPNGLCWKDAWAVAEWEHGKLVELGSDLSLLRQERDALKSEVQELKAIKGIVEPNYRYYVSECKKLQEERDAYREALEKIDSPMAMSGDFTNYKGELGARIIRAKKVLAAYPKKETS